MPSVAATASVSLFTVTTVAVNTVPSTVERNVIVGCVVVEKPVPVRVIFVVVEPSGSVTKVGDIEFYKLVERQ